MQFTRMMTSFHQMSALSTVRPKPLVRETFGEPIKEIRKGLNIYILQESEEFDLFEVDGMYAYVFYDLHKNDTVTAIQLVAKSLEQTKNRHLRRRE